MGNHRISQLLVPILVVVIALPIARAADLVADARKPKDEDARELLAIWQSNARTDGKIPGALVGRLAIEVKYFVTLNKGTKKFAKLEELMLDIDSSRDWSVDESIELLDAVCDIHTIPINNSVGWFGKQKFLAGQPLPAELKTAPWGEPATNGLRAAWHLEPRTKWHRMGTSLKSRILVHNSGDRPVCFFMPSWQQSFAHKAFDADDKPIKVDATMWTTRATMKVYRLAPGDYCETPAAGVGIGERTNSDMWRNVRAGSWIKANAGDRVRLIPGPIAVNYSPRDNGTRMIDGKPENTDPKDAAELWERIVTQRIERELPVPTMKADREQLLQRVTSDLFGEPPTQTELAAFVAKDSTIEDADGLKQLLLETDRVSSFTGSLPSAEISFRVLAADPDAETKPRVVIGPGYFTVSKRVRLNVEQSNVGDHHASKATLRFFAADRNVPPPPQHEIALPVGARTWAITWQGESTVLWVVQRNVATSYDFTDQANVTETRFGKGDEGGLPQQHQDAIDEMFKAVGARMQSPFPKP